MAIETVRLSQKAKDQFITLKRRTGIEHWNVLCRWAFCTSLAEPSIPPDAEIVTNSNVEMDWRTFGGAHHELYLALLKARCRRDGLDLSEDNLSKYVKLHIHRGVGYLLGHEDITQLVKIT
jgi:DNA sulfur modification protein DndE